MNRSPRRDRSPNNICEYKTADECNNDIYCDWDISKKECRRKRSPSMKTNKLDILELYPTRLDDILSIVNIFIITEVIYIVFTKFLFIIYMYRDYGGYVYVG